MDRRCALSVVGAVRSRRRVLFCLRNEGEHVWVALSRSFTTLDVVSLSAMLFEAVCWGLYCE